MTIYNPSATRTTAITMPDDGNDRGVANVVPPIAAALDNAEYIFARCFPFVLVGNRNRPVDAIVPVPNGTTVKVQTTGQSLLGSYNPLSCAMFASLDLDVRNPSGGLSTVQVILGTTTNGVDLDQLFQDWEIPGGNAPRTISISTWLSNSAGANVTGVTVYAKVSNASGGTINVHNVSLSGLILKNSGA